jgi:RNA recognition motif-containing protein
VNLLITHDIFFKIFSAFGEVLRVKIKQREREKKKKGKGYVELINPNIKRIIS